MLTTHSPEQQLRLPGLLDAHIHGIGGCDFSDGKLESIKTITRKLAECGVAYCAATLVSLSMPRLRDALSVLDEYIQLQDRHQFPGSAKIVSVHLEGPFISHCCKGAHDESVLQSKIDITQFTNIISAAPHISDWKITLSPDLEGAIPYIREAKKLVINGRKINVKVFIGHSNADPALLRQAFEAGADGFTHLGNANDEKLHRSTGNISLNDLNSNVVKWALVHRAAPVELIVDGQHLSEQFVNLVLSQVGSRIILITDALSPAGMPDGDYMLGSLPVVKAGNKIVLKNDLNKLAGSAATLPQIIQNFHAILRKAGMPDKEIADVLYDAAVTYPRAATLSESAVLPDDKNYVVLDRNTGSLLFHAIDGVTYENKRPFIPSGAGLRENPAVTDQEPGPVRFSCRC